MAFFSPASLGFEPKRKFRFLVKFSSFHDESIMAIKCSKPSYELSGVTEHRVLNHIFKFPGIVKWNDIDISFIDSAAPDMSSKFWNSLNNSGFVVPDSATALTTGITKLGSSISLGTVTIKQLNGGVVAPTGFGDDQGRDVQQTLITDQWTLKNAFIKSVKWGDLDYSTDDLVNIDVGITYDYALFESYGETNPLQGI